MIQVGMTKYYMNMVLLPGMQQLTVLHLRLMALRRLYIMKTGQYITVMEIQTMQTMGTADCVNNHYLLNVATDIKSIFQLQNHVFLLFP